MTGAPIRADGPPLPATLRELSRPGRRAWTLPELDVPDAEVPEASARRAPPDLPEVAERDIVRHFTRLSQMNYGVDTGFYPLGSCSMKYNPKVAEAVAALPGFQRLHPHQPAESIQGALELLWRLEMALCDITGMARATLQPPDHVLRIGQGSDEDDRDVDLINALNFGLFRRSQGDEVAAAGARDVLVRQLESRPAGDRLEAAHATLRPLGRRHDRRDVPRDAVCF